MKSEHRHELETNELSAGLAKSIERLKPISGQILTGVGLLLALYAGLSIWNAQSSKTEQKAWEAFAFATDSSDPEMNDLQRVAGEEEYAGTKMSEWAFVGWADRQVLNAMRFYFLDREKTQDILLAAEGIYEQFAANASDPAVLNRARFGLARVYELQNKLEEARKQYLTVRGGLEPKASERAEHLESKAVQEACDWLATTSLPKRDLTGGMGAAGTRPDFDATVPSATAPSDDVSTKSIEELLKDFDGGSADDNRYGEKDEAFSTEGTGESPAQDEDAADATSTEKEAGSEAEPADTDSGEDDAASE